MRWRRASLSKWISSLCCSSFMASSMYDHLVKLIVHGSTKGQTTHDCAGLGDSLAVLLAGLDTNSVWQRAVWLIGVLCYACSRGDT